MGKKKSISSGDSRKPPPKLPAFFPHCRTLFQKTLFLRLKPLRLKHRSSSHLSSSQHNPQKWSPSTPFLHRPQAPKPSTQPIPYPPLHSQLTSEPTSFRKPSPIKEARVRIPSSPRHHEQTTTPPILAVHIHQNKTKKITKQKQKNRKKREGEMYMSVHPVALACQLLQGRDRVFRLVCAAPTAGSIRRRSRISRR